MLVYPPALIDPDSFTAMQFIKKFIAHRQYVKDYQDYKISWFRSLDDSEVEAVFRNMLNQIKDVLKKELAVKYKNTNILTMEMDDIEKRLRLTTEDVVRSNRSSMSNRKSENIFTLINIEFPQIVGTLKQVYREHQFTALLAARTGKSVDDLCERINHNLYVETVTSHDSTRKAIQSSQNIINSQGMSAGKKIAELYPQSHLPEKHKQKLDAVVSLCTQLETSKFLPVEDTYFVGEVTKRYIPAMISQYESFTDNVSDTIREAAIKLLNQQLEMIEVKLKKMSDYANIQVIDSIALDASFLKEVTSESSSSLTLKRKKNK